MSKKKTCNNILKAKTKSTAINLRISSYLLSLFSLIGSNKYKIKTISGFLKLSISNINNLVLPDDQLVNEFLKSDLVSYKQDKSYKITLTSDEENILNNICDTLSISKVDAIRKIISYTCLTNTALYPQSVSNNINSSTGNHYTMFRLWCNKESLINFSYYYSLIRKEKNKTAALNDLIKRFLDESKKDSSDFISDVLSQTIKEYKNDFKFNFSVVNSRYDSFYEACVSNGVTPQDCIRKMMIMFVEEHLTDE